MQTRELQREAVLAAIISERDEMILNQHAEILKLQKEISELQKHLSGDLEES